MSKKDSPGGWVIAQVVGGKVPLDQTIWEKEKISRTSVGQYNKGLTSH